MSSPHQTPPLPRHSLLLIDDDIALGRLLVDYFATFGHRLWTASSASAGRLELLRRQPNLVILDLMLPDTDGLTLCKEIRAEHTVPIVMLTARGGVADRVLGLELGADDYLAKPFEPRELVARVDSVLRRCTQDGADDTALLRSGELEVDAARRSARLAGDDLSLTSMEFELLHTLLESRGRVRTREQLLLALRGLEADVYDRAVDMLVSRLRQKLGDNPREPRWIKTVWRVGYQWVGE